MAAHPPGVSSSQGFPNFKYEPLDLSSKRPSIRLAILQPGTKGSTVRITLAQTAFADRPRYEALSYTWGPPGVVKGIELNGIRVDVRENLWSALVHLRDARQERGLWIDAICINQADIEERNHQVKLMAYIFARAEEVLVWLGPMKPETRLEPKTTSRLYEISQILPNRQREQEMEDTAWAEQEQQELVRLCRQPYWKRVWIVQEIGAATKLKVHWGSKKESWDKFVERIRQVSTTSVDMALKLADQREGRHGDSFLLANLMEVCQDSLCEEPRDKIYGFIGIAHDCQDDSLPVDYSKSLFELYEDVIRFQYHWAKETKQALKENKKAIVHFSQLVQKVLGGPAMHQDFAIAHPGRSKIFPSPIEGVAHNFDPFKLPDIGSGTVSIASVAGDISDNFDVFKVTGVHSGTITILGPPYSEIIGDPDASRTWKAKLSKSHANLEELRRKNEGFMRVLLQLNKQDLARICQIETEFWWKHNVDAQRLDQGFIQLPRFKLVRGQPSVPTAPPRVEEPMTEPCLFLSRNGVMGLMPPNARIGDLIFQFWNSATVAVVRQEGNYMRIVGRAVVSNRTYREGSKFHVPLDSSQEPADAVPEGLNFSFDGKDVYMDISTLQLLTQ